MELGGGETLAAVGFQAATDTDGTKSNPLLENLPTRTNK
jgi:hypothetical protein